MTENLVVTTTSGDSAVVSPIVLREGERRRLVFIPLLVNNIHDATACVKGTFVYQVKKQADEWEDVQTISLSTLKAGDQFKLELSSGEMIELFTRVHQLYDHVNINGVRPGTEVLVPFDSDSSAEDVRRLLEDLPEGVSTDAVLGWLNSRGRNEVVEALRDVDPEKLDTISAAVGIARLKQFVSDARANLSNSDEDFWQDLFERNSWVLAQVYSYPVVIIRGQTYMGGKNIAGRDGNVADFLYKNDLTDNALIVEIKTPTEALTSRLPYRNNAHSPTKELAGSVQQVLQNLYTLRRSYAGLVNEEEPEFRIFSPRCLVVIGNLDIEAGVDRRRSFEIFRNNQRDVDIVTFDELIAKAQTLLSLFQANGGVVEPEPATDEGW